jgi:DNA-binding IclR family transcriptional regulator
MIVLNYIKNHPYTDINEIRTVCDLPHQTVTASLSNLMDEGVVKMVGERELGNSVFSTLLFVPSHDDRVELRRLRCEEKMNKWWRQGLTKHLPYMPEHLRNAFSNNPQ